MPPGSNVGVWEMFEAAKLGERPVQLLLLDDFVGEWMDTLGNSVSVVVTDLFVGKAVAILKKEGRADITLTLKFDGFGGWLCGNSALDLASSCSERMRWETMDGRASTWVRAGANKKAAPADGKDEVDTTDSIDDAAADVTSSDSKETPKDVEQPQ
jgi:hypothetical protein